MSTRLCLVCATMITALFGVSAFAATPTLGAHTLTNYFFATNTTLSISSRALATQTAGSTMLVCIGRGDINAFAKAPTDNKGNTPYAQLGSTHAYEPLYPDSGTALYAFSSFAGGAGHVITTSNAFHDEVTMDVVEIKNGGVIQDYKWNEVLQGHPLTTLDVTTTGPATLVAFWWGDGNQYFAHIAVPDSGFTVIDSILPIGSYVQSVVAVKDVAVAGSYHLTWNSGGNEGAQMWLVAVQGAPQPVLQSWVTAGKLVLSWPAAAGYALEATSDLLASNSWASVTNTPVVIGTQNVVTNLISQPSQYYRLRRP